MSGTSYAPGYPARSLPLGVAILAILIGVVGFFFLLAGALLLAVHFAILGGGGIFVHGWVGELLLVILGIVLLAVASGLWDRRLWALALTVLVLVLVLLGNIVAGALVSLSSVVVVLLLVYLVLVRQHFT
jgi:hypothetical protein